MLNILLFFISIAQVYSQSAQPSTSTPDIFNIISQPTTKAKGSVIIRQDDKVKGLMENYIEYRRKDVTIPGYRVRIFSESGNLARQHMYADKAKFMKSFADTEIYFDSDQVYFKLYVGDYRNKAEAYRALMVIKKEFPRAFIVPTRINLPKI